MTDDIKAIRDALAALWPASRSWQADSLGVWKSDGDELADCDTPETATYIAACHPERIARLLDALEQASKDADRYRYLRDRVPAEVLGQVKSAAGCWIDGEDDEGVLILLTGSDADAAIDAAMKRGA